MLRFKLLEQQHLLHEQKSPAIEDRSTFALDQSNTHLQQLHTTACLQNTLLFALRQAQQEAGGRQQGSSRYMCNKTAQVTTSRQSNRHPTFTVDLPAPLATTQLIPAYAGSLLQKDISCSTFQLYQRQRLALCLKTTGSMRATPLRLQQFLQCVLLRRCFRGVKPPTAPPDAKALSTADFPRHHFALKLKPQFACNHTKGASGPPTSTRSAAKH